MLKHAHTLLSIAVLVFFCQCKNADGNKSTARIAKPVTHNTEQITTATTTTTTIQADTTIATNNDVALYASKEEEQKHVTKRKATQNKSAKKTALTPGNFPEGSDRKLVEWDVVHLSKWGYTLMMSEIYARHGMIFKDATLARYFKKVKWYRPKSKNVDKLLTPVERENISFLKSPAIAFKTR